MSPTLLVRRAQRAPVCVAGADASRPRVVVLLERPNPASWPVLQVTRLAQRLRAEVVIAVVVTFERSLEELDRLQLELASEGVQEVTAGLIEHGVSATGEVTLAPYGDHALVASHLAARLNPDLVIVLARRGSWARALRGSPLVHHLMRGRHRPVLVIPDHEAGPGWPRALLELVRRCGPA